MRSWELVGWVPFPGNEIDDHRGVSILLIGIVSEEALVDRSGGAVLDGSPASAFTASPM